MIRSDPSGAEVDDLGPPRRLVGLTPLTLPQGKPGQARRLVLRFPGREEQVISVEPGRSQTLFVSLGEAASTRSQVEQVPQEAADRPAEVHGESSGKKEGQTPTSARLPAREARGETRTGPRREVPGRISPAALPPRRALDDDTLDPFH